MTKRDKITVDDIIGIVHTDEPTDSVEEVKKLRGRENRIEKRFTLHINWFNKEKTEGEALLKDNGQPLLVTERIDDARLLKNILNELYYENKQLKHKLSQQEMEYATTACRQAEENEELKDRIDNYNTAFKKLQDLTERKINENEQLKEDNDYLEKRFKEEEWHYDHIDEDRDAWKHKCQELEKKNGELKKGMIGVVDRYIKNVECNPPSSARTYRKIKGALINIREDLRNLIGRFE